MATAEARSKEPPDLPSVIRFCGPSHCGTLTWVNGHYDATYDDNAASSTYMVELFTAEKVKMNRIDKDGPTAVLTGRLSPDGNRIVDGNITWISGRTGTFPFEMYWGEAINAKFGVANPRQNTPSTAAGTPDTNGVYTKTGNGVTAPKLLSKVEPTYPEVARKLLVDQARVLLRAVIEPDGRASNFSVIAPVGYGLDESAIDAVRQWRFSPGMKDGKPVRIRSTFEVSFQLAHPPNQNTWYSGPMAFSIAASVAPPAVESGSIPGPQTGSSNETAILEFTVDTKGSVKNVHPVHGSEASTQLLGQYLAAWKFRPAIDGANMVEATGRIRFTKGTGDETNNRALFSIPATTPTATAIASANYPSLEHLSPNLLGGQYRREPMLNKWHQGVIATDTKSGDQKLRWWNDAGVSWALTPDMADGILITDFKENPYYDKDPEKGRTFRIRMLPGNAGVDGFEFLGEFYKRISPQIASAANTTPAIALPAPDVPSNQASACIAPPAGLIGWWPGDNDANDIIGGHNPTAVSALSVIPGKVNTGFQFGQQGYIEIPKSPTLENQRFTWLAWVRPDGPGPNTTSLIINQNIDGSDAAVSLGWRSEGQRFSFLSGHNPEDLITSNDTFPPGAFYLVAATYDGSTFKLYVNGKLEASRSSTKTIPYSKYGWEIGAEELRFIPRFPDTWNGVIDELQAYNRALTESEIQSIYQADSAGVCKSGAPVVSTATNNRPAAMPDPPSDAPAIQVNPKDGLKYVWIPPGSFMMSCSEGDTECAAHEDQAQNARILRGFWLGQTEVTQAAYKKVMGTNPSAHKGDQLPVEMVTWFDALQYCVAIGGNLPNESQWEYAARAGTKWARYGGVDAVGWHAGNSDNQTHPVGLKQPNDFDLYDMLGNVSEWVEDTFPGGEAKVERGGSAFANISDLLASSRHSRPPAGSAMSLGFRCTADFPAPEQAPAPTDDFNALAENQQALQANPRSSLAHFRIGELFLKRNNLQSAANEFRNALHGDLNPKWTEVWSHINLGRIFDVTGQPDRAANEYQQAIRIHDNTFGAQSVAQDGYKRSTQPTISGGSPSAARVTPASPPIPPNVLQEEADISHLDLPDFGEKLPKGPSAPSRPVPYDVGPQLLSKVEPEYSEEARKAKYSGTVLLSVDIDTHGNVGAIRVVRPVGLGLDEEAIECVKKWKFKPALKDGKPVASWGTIEISFRLR